MRRRCGVVAAKPALYDRLSGWDNLVYGVLLVLFIIFLPKGILGSVVEKVKATRMPSLKS